jgi:hypothetical protein
MSHGCGPHAPDDASCWLLHTFVVLLRLSVLRGALVLGAVAGIITVAIYTGRTPLPGRVKAMWRWVFGG